MPNQTAKDRKIYVFLIPIAVIFLLFLTLINIDFYLQKPAQAESVLSESTSLEDEIGFWKAFLIENPNYIPGWEEYASINKLVGNENEVNLAIENIKRIDPNYKIKE